MAPDAEFDGSSRQGVDSGRDVSGGRTKVSNSNKKLHAKADVWVLLYGYADADRLRRDQKV